MEGFSENISRSLNEIIEKNLLSLDELQKRIFKCIKELSENESLHILDNFISSDLSSVTTKEVYLYESFLDHLNSIQKPEVLINQINDNVKDISNKQRIKDLLNQSKYTLTLSTGQRRYGGPPPHWEGPPPGTGDDKFCSQVHIGKLGKDVFEDVLVPILESCGRIYQLRIMVNPNTGENKGYAFVDYFTKEEALKFIETYNDKPLNTDSPISAKLSIPNCRIFVGGFATNKTKEEVEQELTRLFENSKDVKAFPSNLDKKRNRGYAFITFHSHNDANQAKKKLQSGKIHVFNQVVRDADWAENLENSVDVETKPKTLFVRYGSTDIPQDTLKTIFGNYGQVNAVDKLAEYAFIDFEKEEDAQKAVIELNNKEIENVTVQVSFAKVNKEKNSNKRKFKQSSKDAHYRPTGNGRGNRGNRQFNDRESRPRMLGDSPRSSNYYRHDDCYREYSPRYDRHEPPPYYDMYHNNEPISYPRYPMSLRGPPVPDIRYARQYTCPESQRQVPNQSLASNSPSVIKNQPTSPRNVNWTQGGASAAPQQSYSTHHSYSNQPRPPYMQNFPPRLPNTYNSTPTRTENPPMPHYTQNIERPMRTSGGINYW